MIPDRTLDVDELRELATRLADAPARWRSHVRHDREERIRRAHVPAERTIGSANANASARSSWP